MLPFHGPAPKLPRYPDVPSFSKPRVVMGLGGCPILPIPGCYKCSWGHGATAPGAVSFIWQTRLPYHSSPSSFPPFLLMSFQYGSLQYTLAMNPRDFSSPR